MKVLSIGSDRSVLDPASASHARQKAYAEALGELHIIVPAIGSGIESGRSLSILPVRNRFLVPFAVAREIREWRPDIITVQDPFEYGLMAYIGSLGSGIPMHVQLHTDMLSPNFTRSFLNSVRVFIAGFVLCRAAAIRVVSQRIKDSLLKEYRLTAPISVLPIYVDLDRFRNASPDNNVVTLTKDFRIKLLVVSRLEREKNVALAIRSFADSAPQDSCLIIAGDGSERQDLEQLANDLDMKGRVFFLGRQDPSGLYLIADLVLVPSDYEGYGLVIIEALAAGKPVLATDSGIAREAGAIIATDISAGLRSWFESGPRSASLSAYPYRDFADYVHKYSSDIQACARRQ